VILSVKLEEWHSPQNHSGRLSAKIKIFARLASINEGLLPAKRIGNQYRIAR